MGIAKTMRCALQTACCMILGFTLLASTCSGNWLVLHNENAVHKAVPGHSIQKTAKDQNSCATLCEKNSTCLMWSFNRNSDHCYLGFDNDWKPSPNDHVNSGCDESRVTGCGSAPAPPAPTPPTPTPPAPTPPPGGDVPVYDGKIRDQSDGLRVAYMVPAGKDNHAATIEALPDGSLVAAWFAGDHEEASGLAIVVSRLTNGSDAWTNSTVVATRKKFANQNPLLFFDSATGTLHLWHTQAPADSGEGEADVYHLSSKDSGVTWSESKEYFSQKGIFIRNRIIRRKDQSLLWPFYSTGFKGENGKSGAFAWSKTKTVPEDGEGWTLKIMKDEKDLEQPTCWRSPLDKKTIECYFRDCGQKNIYAAESKDEGESFSKPKKTDLKNPGSGIEGLPLANGKDIVLLYNPTTDDHRDPLSAGISHDGGKTWTSRFVQNGPSGAVSKGSNEFAYPTVVQTGDGTIHVLYTYGTTGVGQPKTIKYISFTEDWVMKK